MKIPVLKILFLAAAAIGSLPALQADSKRVELRGRWVLDSAGKAVGPDSFRRGLQTSALLYRGAELLSGGARRGRGGA